MVTHKVLLPENVRKKIVLSFAYSYYGEGVLKEALHRLKINKTPSDYSIRRCFLLLKRYNINPDTDISNVTKICDKAYDRVCVCSFCGEEFFTGGLFFHFFTKHRELLFRLFF